MNQNSKYTKLKWTTLLLLFFVLLNSCSKYYHTSFTQKSLLDDIYVNDRVLVIDFDEPLPHNMEFIKNVKKRDFWSKAEIKRSIKKCVNEAKKHNANIVRLMAFQPNDFWSSGYIEAKLYRGDLNNLYEKNINYSAEERLLLNQLQGQRKGEYEFYNANGYDISIFQSIKPYNAKSLESLKNDFKIDKAIQDKQSNYISIQHVWYDINEKLDPGINSFRHVFMMPDKEGGTLVIQLHSALESCKDFEKTFLDLYLNSIVPTDVYQKQEVDSIYFVNRYIPLGPICNWQGVKNIQCPYRGQMDWEILTSLERAENYIQQRIHTTSNKKRSKILSKEEVPVIFEGKEVIAKKYVYQIKLPKILLGGTNTLIVYYVLSEIDSNFIACILSHYENDNNSAELPPLIQEVMKLNKYPADNNR